VRCGIPWIRGFPSPDWTRSRPLLRVQIRMIGLGPFALPFLSFCSFKPPGFVPLRDTREPPKKVYPLQYSPHRQILRVWEEYSTVCCTVFCVVTMHHRAFANEAAGCSFARHCTPECPLPCHVTLCILITRSSELPPAKKELTTYSYTPLKD